MKKIKRLFVLGLCLLPALLIQAASDSCRNDNSILETLFPENYKALLKVYLIENHAVLELHKQRGGSWTESSYSLWPVDEEEEGCLECLASKSDVYSLLIVSTGMVSSYLGLPSLSVPGNIAVNSYVDRNALRDYLVEASFELSPGQVRDLEAFLEESIDAFGSQRRLYSPFSYHCQDFVKDALRAASIEEHFYDHLSDPSLFKADGSLLFGNLNIWYQKYGLFSAFSKVLQGWGYGAPQLDTESLDLSACQLVVTTVHVCEHEKGCLEVVGGFGYEYEHYEYEQEDDVVVLDKRFIRQLEQAFEARYAGPFHPQGFLNIVHKGVLVGQFPLNLRFQQKMLKLTDSAGSEVEVMAGMEIEEYTNNKTSQKVFLSKVTVFLPQKTN